MIEIDNITVEYGGRHRSFRALDSFSLRIDDGEYLAILGPNGSGKSSLLRAICGQVRLAAGKISIDGNEVKYGRFGFDLFGKIGIVFQEPEGQFLMHDVRTEIISVLENLGLSPFEQQRRFAELVTQFDLAGILENPPEKLSGGQMQVVNLACALASNPGFLLLDEPTSFLDPHFQKLLLDYVDSFAASGGTVIHITQYPDEALLAERVAVISGGKSVFHGIPSELFADSGVLGDFRLSVPRRLAFKEAFGFDWGDVGHLDFSQIKVIMNIVEPANENNSKAQELTLEISNLRHRYSQSYFELRMDQLSLNRGEITGLVGPTGSGKSTLAFILSGLIPSQYGEVQFLGRNISEYPEKELRRRLCIGWQFPDATLIGPTVEDDILFGIESMGDKFENISSVLSSVGLEGFEKRIVDTLSGGEKRKLAMAGIIARDPDFIILDEPEAFLDPLSQLELIRIIIGLKSKGKGLLVIAHDLYFLSEFADRIVGLYDGAIKFDIPALIFNSNRRYAEQLGLGSNPIIRFRQCLADNGFSVPFPSLDPARLAECIDIDWQSYKSL